MNCKKEELLQKIEELKKEVEQLDSEFPKYMMYSNTHKYKQHIVEYTSKKNGIVIVAADHSDLEVGEKIECWTSCDETNGWMEKT